ATWFVSGRSVLGRLGADGTVQSVPRRCRTGESNPTDHGTAFDRVGSGARPGQGDRAFSTASCEHRGGGRHRAPRRQCPGKSLGARPALERVSATLGTDQSADPSNGGCLVVVSDLAEQGALHERRAVAALRVSGAEVGAEGESERASAAKIWVAAGLRRGLGAVAGTVRHGRKDDQTSASARFE